MPYAQLKTWLGTFDSCVGTKRKHHLLLQVARTSRPRKIVRFSNVAPIFLLTSSKMFYYPSPPKANTYAEADAFYSSYIIFLSFHLITNIPSGPLKSSS